MIWEDDNIIIQREHILWSLRSFLYNMWSCSYLSNPTEWYTKKILYARNEVMDWTKSYIRRMMNLNEALPKFIMTLYTWMPSIISFWYLCSNHINSNLSNANDIYYLRCKNTHRFWFWIEYLIHFALFTISVSGKKKSNNVGRKEIWICWRSK